MSTADKKVDAKATFADPGEALRLEWIDISGNIVTINHPVKDHLPRQLEVSNKLISMLNAQPQESTKVFATKYSNMFRCYNELRDRVARIQKNPRLLRIEFRSFRHWGGTMLAYYTNGNVLTVQRMLGHRRIANTVKYISMIHFNGNEFEGTATTNVEEDKNAMIAGFAFVTERSGIKLWRRPKRFGGLPNVEDKRKTERIRF